MLNLNLSSLGGRCLKLTDYYQAEARRYLPDRAKTEAETMRQSRGSKVEIEARPCEAEARLSQLKTASRPPRTEADASRTTSLMSTNLTLTLALTLTLMYTNLTLNLTLPN